MPDELKKEDSKEEVKEEKKEDSTQEAQPEQEQQPEPNAEIDYAAELEAEKEARQKAEKDRDNYKEGMLNYKDQIKGDDDGEDEDVAKIVDSKLSSFEQRLFEKDLNEVLSQATTNPDEKELIKYYYQNKIVRSGNLQEDIENAKMLANRKRILAENEELKFANANRPTNTGYGTSVKKDTDENVRELSPQEKAIFNRFNQRRINRGKEPVNIAEFLKMSQSN